MSQRAYESLNERRREECVEELKRNEKECQLC